MMVDVLIVRILTFWLTDLLKRGDRTVMDDRTPAGADALVAFNVLRTHNCLSPFVDQGLRDLRLTSAQLDALLILREAGSGGLPLSELGGRLVVTKASVTGLIDRLEREGLVQRDGHADRRVTLAKLTENGCAVLEEAVPRHRQVLAYLLDCLTGEEKEQIIRLLSKLRRGLREKHEGKRSS
jgi:MarR family transcriptional regulator, 2-MHQ and catechol-resistance regulon repressor